MKLILIHGTAKEAAYKKISEIKKSFDKLNITELSDLSSGFNFSSPSLFSEKRLIIINNPDSKTTAQVLNQTDPDLTILVIFSKQLEKSSPFLKKSDLNMQIFNFTEANETTIFPFLDMLGNQNPRALNEFEKNYKQFGGQYILTMLAYFLRRMVAKSKSSSDFMKQKIAGQKKNFPQEKINNLYKKILETDFQIKQGLAEEKIAITMLVQKILTK